MNMYAVDNLLLLLNKYPRHCIFRFHIDQYITFTGNPTNLSFARFIRHVNANRRFLSFYSGFYINVSFETYTWRMEAVKNKKQRRDFLPGQQVSRVRRGKSTEAYRYRDFILA